MPILDLESICRTPHPISMKIFEGHLGIKWSTENNFMTSLVTWFGMRIFFFFFKRSKTSEVAEQIEAKLYTYNRLFMRNKRFTHMMSLVTWFGSHIGFTLKHIKIFFSRTDGQTNWGETSQKCSPSHVCTGLLRNHWYHIV